MNPSRKHPAVGYSILAYQYGGPNQLPIKADRFDWTLGSEASLLAREYGAAVICLAIDEEGQARTADWKLRVCKRIHDLAVQEYGIDPTDLIFDTLTFPLGSGQEDLRRDGIETIEAIRRIKAELPGVSTILGVSNVSFGLKPALRHVLNSVFLHECAEAGLDSAIVHAARISTARSVRERIASLR